MPRRPPRPGLVPLERALSKLGLASRTVARDWIQSGRIALGGRVCTVPEKAVHPETLVVTLDGRPLVRPPPWTIAFNKPRGVVTTARDPEGRPTIYASLGDVPVPVMPVGRLDAATTGLLLLTNDTRFSDWVLDPANGVPRTYLVAVRGELADAALADFTRGVVDRGETLRALAAAIRKRSRRETHLVITLTEGKNREIRRLCAAVGHEVTSLKRVAFGRMELGRLAPGAWRKIGAAERATAFPGSPPPRDGTMRAR